MGWGFVSRPYPAMTGHGFLTRQASGQQKMTLDALKRGEFVMKPPYTGAEHMVDPDEVSLSRAVRAVERWAERRPATTVVGSFNPNVIAAPGYRTVGGASRQNAEGSVNVSVEEAATLQSFPPDFVWDATRPNGKPLPKGAKYLAIGNAVPPLMARRVLEALWTTPAEAEAAA